ncbi:tRNA (mnm(5)s(2)U34)-methyltransferase [Caproiciproducens sp. MSJ-32]|uniref:tRNA (mnm(5)s(2)U34)-methyltransferase n=1 Tax=Caproiciproducens sp. MSJ-32 TaxID=2841527 RepID=UPI001C0FF0E5|nr:class I SAM-dependent methyltransferase [Caproiciproducens sp. MSJ-32]MBU5454272.1 class I SAM-dependent methyltransferase [Caproiciproducens sp. MSJ-32]
MFKYVGNISDLSHYIIDKFIIEKKVAIDATLGNGYDTDFLADKFEKVYSFDIQKEACEKYLLKNLINVKIINASHHFFEKYIKEKVDCIMYNLGFLPGGDKNVTTMHDTTLMSIKKGLELLNNGGIMTICIYRGHNEGKIEETCILEYLKSLDKYKFGVMLHSYLNRDESAPILAVVEKK